ncbi:protein TonB [Paenibacillus sophorae]|uniref:Protein TonB n=1 Tax=Paenibacillus sophorae TaxID=1333845 RepID=A0A1H8UEG4_9BACL|nr:DUF6550 family protein [Paenibacillus sophorae]QWU13162.1 hypothetical protein KP014_14140 [Paenibacillus sophorae]SEP01486.1 protein TonB [Paenibacillus sophorae]
MKRKTWGLIGGLMVVGIVAIWTVWPHSQSDVTPVMPAATSSATPSDVTIKDIQQSPSAASPSPSPSPVVVAEIKPQPAISEAPVLQPEKETKQVEVPISEPKKTPAPTEPPKPKVKETEKAQSPASPPVYEEKETQPNKQAAEPKAGDKNSKGQVYFPGFGWVDDSGPNQETTVGKEGDELTGNKVGTMD